MRRVTKRQSRACRCRVLRSVLRWSCPWFDSRELALSTAQRRPRRIDGFGWSEPYVMLFPLPRAPLLNRYKCRFLPRVCCHQRPNSSVEARIATEMQPCTREHGQVGWLNSGETESQTANGPSAWRPRQDSNLRSRFRRPVLGITLLNMQKARSEACAPSLRQSRSGCVSGPTESLQYSRSLIPGSADWHWTASPSSSSGT